MLRVSKANRLLPYIHDQLFISVYESCKHRSDPINDARALSDTIFNKLVRKLSDGIVNIDDIKSTTLDTLKHFDNAAAVHYQAYYL